MVRILTLVKPDSVDRELGLLCRSAAVSRNGGLYKPRLTLLISGKRHSRLMWGPKNALAMLLRPPAVPVMVDAMVLDRRMKYGLDGSID